MELKIVYDNEAAPGFRSGWGFSTYLEIENEKILFDTGWDGNILLSNLKELGVQQREINKIFLSHMHWDHIGGITQILDSTTDVYLPNSFSTNLKNEISDQATVHEIKEMQRITDRTWTTGELDNKIKEQSLAIELEKGILVITGCSHPGVSKIISTASEIDQIYGLLGGLHDFKDYEVLENLEFIVPTHCTKNKKEIKELYPRSFVKAYAGKEIRIQ